jgi:hypothetical protein
VTDPTATATTATTTAARRWVWPLLIAALALAGVLLALADISLGAKWPNPFADALVGPPRTQTLQAHAHNSNTNTTQDFIYRFDRTRAEDRLIFASPFNSLGLGPLSPAQALRAFLTNGAGLVLLALAALVLFPSRARNAVERLEGRYGAMIAVGAGIVMVLLGAAAITLLRFTLLFLAVVPLVLLIAMTAALFGIACISLAIGRLLNRRLNLPRAHALVPALAGALVVFDLAVIPYAGVFALAFVAIAGLGLAVVTRFGSSNGWSFGDLSW